MTIQLQHVKTGMYIATQPKLVAEHERSCSAVMLQERVASGCFFRVESRYKFREDGASVLKTDEIFLTNMKVPPKKLVLCVSMLVGCLPRLVY